jgi:hypothetical protein
MREIAAIEESTTFSRDILDRVLQSGKIVDKRAKDLTGEIGNHSLSSHSMSRFSRKDITLGQAATQPPAYLGRHEGRPFLILANGPSLRSHREDIERFILKHNPVVFGNNNVHHLFVPHYHIFTNKLRFFQYVSTVHEKSQLVAADFFEVGFVRENTARECEIVYVQQGETRLSLMEGSYVITLPHIDVGVVSISLAVLMGAKTIFVAGMDGYQEGMAAESFHFYREETGPEDPSILIERHRGVCLGLDRTVAMLDQRNISLVILTPTSHQRLYCGLDNYLSESE